MLIDASGARVMPEDGHPLRDLAPRDVVTKQMSRVMSRTGTDHLFLDARGLGAEVLLRRFPTIVATCRAHGIDPVVDPIPVTPAAHYASGGVRTDLNGRVASPRVRSPGCTPAARSRAPACTAPTGSRPTACSRGWSSPRASGMRCRRRCPTARAGRPRGPRPACCRPATLRDLTTTMTDGAGVLRSAASLEAAAKSLGELGRRRRRRRTRRHRAVGGDQRAPRRERAGRRRDDAPRDPRLPLARGLSRRRRGFSRPSRDSPDRRRHVVHRLPAGRVDDDAAAVSDSTRRVVADVVDRALAEDLGAADPRASAVDVTSTADDSP